MADIIPKSAEEIEVLLTASRILMNSGIEFTDDQINRLILACAGFKAMPAKEPDKAEPKIYPWYFSQRIH